MRMGHIKLAHPLLVIYSFNDLRISTQVYELRFTGFFVKLVRPQVKTCWCVGLVEFPVDDILMNLFVHVLIAISPAKVPLFSDTAYVSNTKKG